MNRDLDTKKIKLALKSNEDSLDGINYQIKFKFGYCEIKSPIDEDPVELSQKFHPHEHFKLDEFRVIDSSEFKIKFEHKCIKDYILSSEGQFLGDEDEMKMYFMQFLRAPAAMENFWMELNNIIRLDNCKIYDLNEFKRATFTWWESLHIIINSDLKLVVLLHGSGDDG